MAFSRSPERRTRLLQVSEWLEGRSGMTTLVNVLEGRGPGMRKQREDAEKVLARDIQEGGFRAFPLVVSTDDIEDGIHHIVQAAGIGPLRVNTILTNWIAEDPPKAQGFQELLFGRNLREAYRQGCNVVVMAADDIKWERLAKEGSDGGMLDVWWQHDATGRLMLLLAYLMTRHDRWRDDRLRVLIPVPHMNHAADALLETVNHALSDYRIQAETKVIQGAAQQCEKEFFDDTDLLLLPFHFQGNLIRLPFEGPVDDILGKLPGTMLVAAARDIDLDPEPEEGEAAARAEVLDRIEDLQSQVKRAEKEAALAAESVARMHQQLMEMLNAETGFIDLQAKKVLDREVAEAERTAERTRRRALKLMAKFLQAQEEAEKDGVIPSLEQEQKEQDQGGN